MALPAGALVDPADLEGKFEAGNPEFFVTAAEAEVRKFCGWHIAPSVTVTNGRYPAGERGLVMLPSLHVTDVASVAVDGHELDQHDYDWEPCGLITRRLPSWSCDPYVTVTWTHGYEVCPADIAAVVFELASSAIELPASPARDVTAGPFRLVLGGAVGLTLDKNQRDRLANYRIQGIA
ncbi:hypothetical protein [Mycolicibacterium fortuitum]|uniref:hypothetical protein n=1 Tax=Mycolicibacterium fortuitum TaxID=1766 RepID=UPI0007EB6B6D|nr:hypothetical protein [Mycolicibacterium fortuitum]OBF77092.1 hypothetical protein A5751_23220 [Mycolicibacterium fortuitum]